MSAEISVSHKIPENDLRFGKSFNVSLLRAAPPVGPRKQHWVHREVMRTLQKGGRVSRSTYAMLVSQIVEQHTPVPGTQKHFAVSSS